MCEQFLSEEAKAARREYSRQWREKNRDKVREINRRYWENVARKRHESEVGDDAETKG